MLFNQIKSLSNKIISIIKRGYVSLVNDDSGSYSTTQVSYLGNTANVETIYPYGLNANAPLKTMILLLNVNAAEENLAGICYTQAERFKNLKAGEVVVGSPYSGSYIKFMQNGDIEINSEKDIKIKATNVNFDAHVELGIGGQQIARLGDQVTVGSETGTITTAGTNKST